MKSRIIVSAIIKNQNQYLLVKKPDNIGPYPNTWHLVGGGANLENETLEEAIKREITEEIGIKATNLKKISFDEDYEPDKKGELTHYIFLTFQAIYKSGNPKAQG